MSESGDYQPVSWAAGHSFKDARADYDKSAGRSYADAVATGKTLSDLLPESLTTDSDAPLLVDCDETGSMGHWPGIIFSKLPYLYHEASTEYLGKGTEISFGAFGDFTCREKYPVQARPFGKGEDLTKSLKELVIEGGGGGNNFESSELSALYRLHCVHMPKAVKKPIYILITDDNPRDHVPKEDAAAVHVLWKDIKAVHENLEDRASHLSTMDLFAALKEKYSVYVVLKDGRGSGDEKSPLRMRWEQYVDADHVADLDEAERVMDVILGILAQETGRIDYFKKEIEGRQTVAQVDTTYKALKTIHQLPAHAPTKAKKTTPGGKSTMFKGKGGKKTDDLA